MAIKLLTLLLTLSASLSPAAPTPEPEPHRKPFFLGVPVSNPDALDPISNRFIVVYNSTYPEDRISLHQSKWTAAIAKINIGKRSLDGRALSTKATSFRMGSWRALALEADDRTASQMFDAEEVAYIERDARISLSALSVQAQAPSGLARLSHAAPGGTGYTFDSSAGEGITAFVVDTGIMTSHVEFQGRATFAANFVNDVVCLCFFPPTKTIRCWMAQLICEKTPGHGRKRPRQPRGRHHRRSDLWRRQTR